MSGIAIIVREANFAENKIKKVTPIGNISLQSIEIVGPDLIQTTGIYSVVYNPEIATDKEVVWSIESGNEYAYIDEHGVLNRNDNSSIEATVVISAKSKLHPEIAAYKTVVLEELKPEYVELPWEYGFWNTTGGYYGPDDATGAKKSYVSFSPMLPLPNDEYKLTISDSFYARIIAKNDSGTFKRTGNLQGVCYIKEQALSMLPTATIFSINVYHTDVVAPGSGTAISEDELSRMNEIAKVEIVKM